MTTQCNGADNLAGRLLEEIAEINATKRENGLMPEHASLDEIFNAFRAEIKDTLRDLCRAKQLEWYKTVNGIPMFKTITPKNI